MKTTFVTLLSLCSLLISGCGQKEDAAASKKSTDGNVATAPVEYLANAAKAEQSMEKQIDTAAINNALQLFAVQEGRIPNTLDELVEKKYLKKLPTPPFGSKLQYDKDAGKVTVVKE